MIDGVETLIAYRHSRLRLHAGTTCHEVLGAQHSGVLQGRNAVIVLETTVQDGNGHALATIACLVEHVASVHLDLVFGSSVELGLDGVDVQERTVCQPVDLLVSRFLLDSFRRCPYEAALLDAGELCQLLEQQCVSRAHQHAVLPTATAYHLDTLYLEFTEVTGTDGQVGLVDCQSLSVATLDGLLRQKQFGLLDGVGAAFLVDEHIPIYK